jgi:integrase
MTVKDWLEEWFTAVYGVAVDASREELLTGSRVPGRTVETYASIINVHLIPALGSVQLQRLRTTHVRKYFDDVGKRLEMSTCQVHYILLQSALEAAVQEELVTANVARRMTGKPRKNREDSHEEAMVHCWDYDEAQAFVSAARDCGPQWAALAMLAIDSGMRKGELCGLHWPDIDWDAGTVIVRRSLTRASRNPLYGPTKGRRLRTLKLMPETMAALKAHKKHQAEVRLAAGPAYHNHGLVFAKEPSRNRTDTLGCPLQSNNIGQREYAKIIEAAGVKPIKFHGLRHTCATLLLQSGAKPYEVSERLGHRDTATTMEIYAHVLPSAEAALVDLMRKGLGFLK